jgi:hypothetical protein
MAEYCIPEIEKGISKLEGLQSEGISPRRFLSFPKGGTQQLSLFG